MLIFLKQQFVFAFKNTTELISNHLLHNFNSQNIQSPFFRDKKHLLTLNFYVYKYIKIISKYLY